MLLINLFIYTHTYTHIYIYFFFYRSQQYEESIFDYKLFQEYVYNDFVSFLPYINQCYFNIHEI